MHEDRKREKTPRFKKQNSFCIKISHFRSFYQSQPNRKLIFSRRDYGREMEKTRHGSFGLVKGVVKY